MFNLLSLLDKLLTLLQGWVARQENKKAQEARDELEQNPADWFDEHFSNGVRPDDSSKTDKTNT
jgi:hypothetical protein